MNINLHNKIKHLKLQNSKETNKDIVNDNNLINNLNNLNLEDNNLNLEDNNVKLENNNVILECHPSLIYNTNEEIPDDSYTTDTSNDDK
jgi:hypothetical protein